MMLQKTGKELCDCGKMAVWLYMPGYSKGGNPFSCDDCIISEGNKNGCSCNWSYGDLPEGIEGKDWRWVEGEDIPKETHFIYLDERGRPFPCCEYEYDEEGFDIDDEIEEE